MPTGRVQCRRTSRACVVCWHHREWGVPAYQLYTGLLFGLPLAVTSFNRYSRFSEALGRRLLFLLVSLYFDDAHLTMVLEQRVRAAGLSGPE